MRLSHRPAHSPPLPELGQVFVVQRRKLSIWETDWILCADKTVTAMLRRILQMVRLQRQRYRFRLFKQSCFLFGDTGPALAWFRGARFITHCVAGGRGLRLFQPPTVPRLEVFRFPVSSE